MSLRAHAARKVQTATIESTFGPNPCTLLHFQDEAGETHTQLCNSPRCPDCGPRKAATLWQGLTNTFGAQVNLYGVDNDEQYKKIRDSLRKHRERHGETEYASFHLGGGHRVIITNADLTKHTYHRVMLASLKKGLLEAYMQGRAFLRKSWNIASVTLSLRSFRKSVTGKLKYSPPLNRRDKEALEWAADIVGEWQVWEDQEGKQWDTVTLMRTNT